MQHLFLTLPDTPANLALDEWLLQYVEDQDRPSEILRVWENPEPAVILGRSSKLGTEVNQAFCAEHGISTFRRCSGGASVMIGPGCLMYAVVLDYRLRPELKMLDQAHEFVMHKIQSALETTGLNTQFQGTCDLTWQNQKFSGNSLRCQRHAMLYHGTLLYDYDLSILNQSLGIPPRQPDYRQGRDHRSFVTNLPVSKDALSQALNQAWATTSPFEAVDRQAVNRLADTKYRDPSWTAKL